VTWELPELYVLNVMFGEMHLKYKGRVVFEDRARGVRCEVEVDPPAPKRRGDRGGWAPDMVTGRVVAGGRAVDEVSGSWLEEITWARAEGGRPRRYFRAGVTRQHRPAPAPGALPSDSRHREDVAHFNRGDMAGAARWKAELEQRQRTDRRQRGTHG